MLLAGCALVHGQIMERGLVVSTHAIGMRQQSKRDRYADKVSFIVEPFLTF